jgi:hypothetical protein
MADVLRQLQIQLTRIAQMQTQLDRLAAGAPSAEEASTKPTED